LLAVTGFNDMVSSTIDETLSDLLSIPVMESLYVYLLKNHGMTRANVPYRLDLFSSALDDIFGAKSSRTIARAVARKLYAHFNLRFEDKPDSTLSDFVDRARNNLKMYS